MSGKSFYLQKTTGKFVINNNTGKDSVKQCTL